MQILATLAPYLPIINALVIGLAVGAIAGVLTGARMKRDLVEAHRQGQRDLAAAIERETTASIRLMNEKNIPLTEAIEQVRARTAEIRANGAAK